MSPVEPLSGWTVGITAERRREELGTALERRGAAVMYGPAIRVVPLADDTELFAATKRCATASLDYVVATTGVGFRGWLDAADGWGLASGLLEAFGEADILTRGPKVRGAVRAAGLRETWSPESESSDEVLRYMLDTYSLEGTRVAVQLHGDPLRDLVDALRARGAEVIEVPVYRWEPPADEQPLRQLISAVADATVDAVTFTSAPAATNFLRTADAMGVDVRGALRESVLCAAVGPVTAAPLTEAGIPVVQPDRFRLGALVRLVAETMPERALAIAFDGRAVEFRGSAVVVNGRLVPAARVELAALRRRIADGGDAPSRESLARLLPAGSN